MLDLNQHSALVTGSSQGIGLSIAQALAKSGAKICLHGLKKNSAAEEAIELVRSHDQGVNFVEGDLANGDTKGIDQLFESAVQQNPNIDLLVNNAGTYCDKPFLEMDFDTFHRTMLLNVYAYYFLTQRFARYWTERKIRGRVILVGSINGRLAEPNHTAYDTSKGAVEMMVKSLCVSLAPHGIRVNGIAPGLFVTPLTASALSDQKTMDWMKLHTPNGEVPGPEVCGEAAVYLLSDEAKHVNGQMLLVDGGMSVWQQPDPPHTT